MKGYNMNRIVIAIVGLCTVMLAGCLDTSAPVKNQQAEAARIAANSIQFTDNAEIENIKKRVELTSKPGLMGFIMLLNQAGQPILYEGVTGKVTSGGKRLTTPDRASSAWGSGTNTIVRASPSDEGTWGSSGEYIFYWNQSGEYRQWNGGYLYSPTPFRLRIEPLVITVDPVKK
jgi:hypothetical protein